MKDNAFLAKNEAHIFDQNYWDERWKCHDIGWDIGSCSPPIVYYMKQYPNKNARILIPGCGNAYEAECLLKMGFTNITVLDYAETASKLLAKKFSGEQSISVVCEDFFEHEGTYDLIIEQTFFCSFSPSLRKGYAKKVAELLANNGKMVGVLFIREFKTSPPFGGNIIEYKTIFKERFTIKTMEKCYNSIVPRQGSEIFVILEKALYLNSLNLINEFYH